jgi:hypothetical protein
MTQLVLQNVRRAHMQLPRYQSRGVATAFFSTPFSSTLFFGETV